MALIITTTTTATIAIVAIILANHTQTLSILGALDLAWPPVVRAILSALTLFQIESASCLLPAAVPSFWLYAFVVLGLSSITIGGTTLAMVYCEYKGKRKQADRLDFILSVLYAVLFVYSYQVCSAVLRTRGDIATIGFVIAVPLLILLLLLLMRFYFKLKAFKRAPSGGGWRGATWFSANGKPIHPKSLALQCYYLTYRFASHGQNWQFVIWLRQLSLIIAIGIVKFIANLVPEKAKGTAGYHYPAAFVFLLIIVILVVRFRLFFFLLFVRFLLNSLLLNA